MEGGKVVIGGIPLWLEWPTADGYNNSPARSNVIVNVPTQWIVAALQRKCYTSDGRTGATASASSRGKISGTGKVSGSDNLGWR